MGTEVLAVNTLQEQGFPSGAVAKNTGACQFEKQEAWI